MGNLTKLAVDSSFHVPSVVGEYRERAPIVRTVTPSYGTCGNPTQVTLTGTVSLRYWTTLSLS